MLRNLDWTVVILLMCFSGFIATTQWRGEITHIKYKLPPHDRVVINSPILTILFGGDRFLAANLESIRLSTTGLEIGVADTFYALRAHKVVADLNACHEQNYYLANALLTWGGAVEEGGEVLEKAMNCRFWDELPPFLYGFNQYFFNHNIAEAQRLLRLAADRSVRNADAFRTLAIMIQVDQIDDLKMAMKLLVNERDKAKSPNLKKKLNMRIARLEGLQLLRNSQRLYEEQAGKSLAHPNELITTGLLKAFPSDPLGIGYVFDDGNFDLKRGKVAGMRKK